MKLFITILTIFVVAGMAFRSPESKSEVMSNNLFVYNNLQLQTGDIVLRSGKGFISDMFRKTSSTDTRYSHAGILVIENNQFFVYHMLGTAGTKKNGFKKDQLREFCNSNENTGYAVYRYPELQKSSTDVANSLKKLEKQKIVFDDSFDLSTDHALYCTELIYKIVSKHGGFHLPLSSLNGVQYVSIDNLYLNQYASQITEFTY